MTWHQLRLVLYPLYLPLLAAHRSPRVRRWLWIGALVAIVTPILAVTMILNNAERSGWNEQIGRVIGSGSVVTNGFDTVNYVTVPYNFHGHPQTTSFQVQPHPDGTVPVWIKGDSVVVFTDPTEGLYAILWINVLSLIVWVLLYWRFNRLLGDDGWLYFSPGHSRFAALANRRRQRRHDRADAERIAPADLAELRTLVETHARRRVTIKLASKATCSTGVIRFRDEHFPGRNWVRLVELGPFLNNDHTDGRSVSRVVIAALQRANVVRSDFQVGDLQWPSAT